MVTRADKFTSLDRKNQVYSDFLTNLNAHPVAKDITRFVNEPSVIRSIRNLLSTDRGERLYQPTIGSDIRKMLFEPMGTATANELATLVASTIDQHEPRAKIINVDVIPQYENNRYVVNLSVLLINKSEPVNFNVVLTRVR